MLFTALSAVALSAGARGPSAARARQCGMASVSGLIYAADEANDDQALPTPPPPPPGRRLTWPRGTHMMAGADLARGAAVRRTRRILLSQEGRPAVRLFTKEGCTLCEAAKEVLVRALDAEPHSLEAVDITDAMHKGWWDKYKYDIPVLHIDGEYWAKHRLTEEDVLGTLAEARAGRFTARRGEPNAARRERPRGSGEA